MEFADLDGLCWTPSALLTRCQVYIFLYMLPLPKLIGKQRLSTLSPPTRSRRPSRPSSPPSSPSAFAVLTNTDFTSSDDTTTIRAPRQHSSQPQLRSTRSRSPVKGVFTGRDTHAHGDDLFSPSNPPRLLVAGLDHNASDLVRPQIRRPIGTSPNVPSPPSPGRNSALTSPSSSLLPPRQLPIVQPIRVVPVANAMSEADDDDGLKTPVSVRSYSDYGQRGSTKRKR